MTQNQNSIMILFEHMEDVIFYNKLQEVSAAAITNWTSAVL